MMDCKAALSEANGDLEQAETILRKKGMASADKKAGRAAKEGTIAAQIGENSRVGTLIEVNCETDFVAKNENFKVFVDQLLQHITATGGADTVEELNAQLIDGQSVEEFVKSKVGQLGENLVLRRFVRYELAEGVHGVVGSYIHLAGKVGVLIEVTAEKAEIVAAEQFLTLVKDLTLHIAAAAPAKLHRDEVDATVVAKEREIYADQMKGKPENVVEKIIEGKLDKFYANYCLLEQGFVKDPDQSITSLLESTGKQLGGEVKVARFTRFAVGEEI